MIDYEFYETPHAFSNWLFDEIDVRGRVFEPCVGSGAIVQARWPPNDVRWFTNDLDPRWPADVHKDARDRTLWEAHEVDWTVTNPPFTAALDIASLAIEFSRIGVAMHLRASIHEVLKNTDRTKTGKLRKNPGVRRTWMAEHTPTGILWLPRFGYQRSKSTGKWATDSVCACWVIWLKDPSAHQFIRYAPERVLDELDTETPFYRSRMDLLMTNLASSEKALLQESA